jgi:hypothetical protein
MPDQPERNRRAGVAAALFAAVIVLIVLAALFGTCQSGDETASDQPALEEEQGPAPGVQ